jgi:endogenous inhibitor of DNA gyrase (YacG/DUF329 family)
VSLPRPEPSPRRCPTCRREIPEDARHRPFCSARCKMVDLGRWFDQEYVVPGPDAVSFEGVDLPGLEHDETD